MTEYCFDHVSIGVRDAEATLAQLRAAIGVTPLSGERLSTYLYVLTRAGDADSGMQLELIQPQGGPESFMHRFLEKHGEGVHHLTFTVPDIEKTIAEVEAAGFTVVQVDLHYPPWREAFILPTEPGLGVVIQFADTSLSYPPMPEFIGEVIADPAAIPHNDGGTDRYWWQQVRSGVAAGPLAFMSRVELESEHPRRIIDLLMGPLGGHVVAQSEGEVDLAWGDSVLRVKPGATSGVRALVYRDGPLEGFTVGDATFVRESPGGNRASGSADNSEGSRS